MSQKETSLNRRDFLGAASVLTLAPAVYAEGWYPVAVPGVTRPYELWY